MCCHCQLISPPGFATLKTRPMNSVVVNSNPIASSGEKLLMQVCNRSTVRFYCNSPMHFASPWEDGLG